MILEDILNGYIISDSAFTALIGTDDDGNRKLYADEAPEGTPLNYVTYMQVSPGIESTLDGKCEYEHPSYQWTVSAVDKPMVKQICKVIKDRLTDFRGVLSGVEIQGIDLTNDLTGKSRIGKDGTMNIDTGYLEFTIHYINNI